MSLPKLEHPIYELKIPSNKKTFRYRPYTVKEQKILLMLQDSSDVEELLSAFKDLISSCSLTEINLDKLTYFDLEYMFIKIRSKSVGEISTIRFKCNNIIEEKKCNHVTQIDINLDELTVDVPSKIKPIKINDNVIIQMKYPNVNSTKLIEQYNSTRELNYLISAIIEDVDFISDSEKVYDDFSTEELKEFISGLNLNIFAEILSFYVNTPKLSKKIDFKCEKCSHTDTIILSGINDFFE